MLARSFSSTNQDNTQTNSVFYDEFVAVMRSFGDGEHPIKESVQLVEKIVLHQIRAICNEVLAIAEKRGNYYPNQQDFEFLMRKNPQKVQSLRKYLKNLNRLKTKQGRMPFVDQLSIEEESSEEEHIEKYDEEKTRRLFRNDHISKILSLDTCLSL